MVAPYYIMPGGKFPFQNGHPVLITQEQFEECCCGEVDCPYDPWPGDAPDLLIPEGSTIRTEFWYQYDPGCSGTPDGWEEVRLIEPGGLVLFAAGEDPCVWLGSGDTEVKTSSETFEINTLWGVEITEYENVCRWRVGTGSNFLWKFTGNTPVGTYSDTGCLVAPEANSTRHIGSINVEIDAIV